MERPPNVCGGSTEGTSKTALNPPSWVTSLQQRGLSICLVGEGAWCPQPAEVTLLVRKRAGTRKHLLKASTGPRGCALLASVAINLGTLPDAWHPPRLGGS